MVQSISRAEQSRAEQSRAEQSALTKVISLTSFYATKRKTEFTTKRVSSVFCV